MALAIEAPARTHPRFLPPQVARFLKNRALELAGGLLLAAAILIALALLTYNALDPSASMASGRAPENWLGARGAAAADAALRMLGLAIGFGAITAVMILSKLPKALRRFRVVEGLVGLSRALRRILLTPSSGLLVLLLAVFGHACAVSALYVMGLSMGLNINFTDMLVIVPAVILIAMLPISIAGWGLREAAMINGLALIGASQSGALALSVLFGLLLIAVGLPGGILWLIDRKKLPRDELLGATETEGKL